MFGEAVLRQARKQRPANPKVHYGALAFGDQRVGRLLNPVVEEGIRFFHAKDQPGADAFQKRSVDLLFRLSEDHYSVSRSRPRFPDRRAAGERSASCRAVAGASPPSNRPRCRSSALARIRPMSQIQPCRHRRSNRSKPFLSQRVEKLDCKKWIAAGLLVDQLRQRASGFRPAAQGVSDEPLNVIEPERRQHDFLNTRCRCRGSRPASASAGETN